MNVPNNFETDPAISKALIRNAREFPMDVILVDEQGNTAHGNSVTGFRFFYENGNSVTSDQAEPFYLVGVDFVIENGLLGIKPPETEA